MAKDSLRAYRLLVIGGSAGSLEAIMQLLPLLEPSFHLSIIIVVHRKNGESVLSHLLSDKTQLAVKEAEEKDELQPGTVYIAPADYHLLVERDGTLSLDFSEKVHYSRPSIDVSFETAAEAFGPGVIGILLSGANADGAQGLKTIQDLGGLAIVQEPSEAQVDYMPRQAIQLFKPRHVLPVSQIADLLNSLF